MRLAINNGWDGERATLTPEALDRIRDGLREWIAEHVRRRRSFDGVEAIRERFRMVYDQVLSDLGYFACCAGSDKAEAEGESNIPA